MMVALLLFIRYTFDNWNLRKVYFEVPEYNLSQFDSAIGRYLDQEARMVDHQFANGRYWDSLTLSLFRDKWHRLLPQFSGLME